MERNIVIKVIDKVAYAQKDAIIVCNNCDYTVIFEFDDEWAEIDKKTARFFANGKYTDVIFTGESVQAPPIYNAAYVLIGVFAGDITTTPARVRCEKSVLCEGGAVAPPSEDVYGQILKLLNEINENKVTPEQIEDAVTDYLEENPIKMFKTDETLTLDPHTNVLTVNRADKAEQDNTLPITSAAVHTELGNIEVLLANI